MTQREAERVVIQRAKRLAETMTGVLGVNIGSRPVSSYDSGEMMEAVVELRDAVNELNALEEPARRAARRHTEGSDW